MEIFWLIFLVILAALGFVVYFLPSIIAELRKHPQGMPILVVNLFFGWTLIGWVVALAWSFSAQKRSA
jgi:RsiW-degrading membrane proteinase PrsW (M82 family)